MRKITIYMALTLACFAITGCGQEKEESIYGENTSIDTSNEERQEDPRLTSISPKAYGDCSGLVLDPGTFISVLAIEKSSPYWSAVKEGAQQAINDLNFELGYSGKNQITLSYNTPANSEDVEEMINILDSELSRYPSAVAIAISDVTAFGMQFDQAMDNGIPIVAFEAESESTSLSATIATDYAAASSSIVNSYIEETNNNSSLFVLASELDTAVSQSKLDGILSAVKLSQSNDFELEIIDLSDLSNIKLEMLSDRTWVHNNLIGDDITVASNPNDENYEELQNSISDTLVLTYLFTANSDYDGFITFDESCSTLLLEVMDELSISIDDKFSASFDYSDQQLEYLKDGTLKKLHLSNPYGMGYASVIAAVRGALDMGNEAFINPGNLLLDYDSYIAGTYDDFLY